MPKSSLNQRIVSKSFQNICDAVMDLDPQPIIGHVPEDLIECSQLVVMADAAAARSCVMLAEALATVKASEIANLIAAHHEKLSHYLYIRSVLLNGNDDEASDDSVGIDMKIF